MTDHRFTCRIGAAHPSLPGHFPGNPLVPGVVLLDRVCEQALLLLGGGRVASLPMVKFLAPVRPEQDFEIVLQPAAGGRVSFRIELAGHCAVQGSLMVAPE